MTWLLFCFDMLVLWVAACLAIVALVATSLAVKCLREWRQRHCIRHQQWKQHLYDIAMNNAVTGDLRDAEHRTEATNV